MGRLQTCQALGFILALFGALLPVAALSQSPDEYTRPKDFERLETDKRFQPLRAGAEIGDAIAPDTGTLSIQHTDIELPGNNGLPVGISRRYLMNGVDYSGGAMGGWTLDVPFITARVLDSALTASGALLDEVCYFSAANRFLRTFHDDRDVIHYGFKVNIPGRGLSSIKLFGEDLSPSPSTAFPFTANFPENDTATTEHFDKIYCGGPANNGSGPAVTLVTAAGTRYHFNQLVPRYAGIEVIRVPAGQRRQDVQPGVVYTVHWNLVATRVEDVHGNWVEYDYDQSNLVAIRSSDGRRIDLVYNPQQSVYPADPSMPWVSHPLENQLRTVKEVHANGRIWKYSYAPINGNNAIMDLKTVELPDGRTWQYSLLRQHHYNTRYYNSYHCYAADRAVYQERPVKGEPESHHVITPEGLRVDYTFDWIKIGNVGQAPNFQTGVFDPVTSANCEWGVLFSVSRAVKTRTATISPGQAAVTTFDYDEDNGSFGQLAYVGSRRRVIHGPSGEYTQMWTKRPTWYSLDHAHAEVGDVVRKVEGTGDALVETLTDYTPIVYGMVRRPSRVRVIQGGETYQTEYAYDADTSSSTFSYGAPLSVSTSSTLQAGARVQTRTYQSDRTNWILNQLMSDTQNGRVVNSYDRNPQGQVTVHRRFGAVKASIGYHGPGNFGGAMASIADGVGNVTTFSNYHRGKPRQIIQPGGAVSTQTVDDNGWVTSVTNQLGYTESYAYNALGWLTTIDRPAPWSDSSLSYAFLASGIQITATTGQKQTVTSYDTRFNTTMIEDRATNDPALTRHVASTYDLSGRKVFESYPYAGSTVGAGTATTYDALGRPLTVQDTATGAITETQYLSGNRVRTIDPRGNATLISRSGYGSPSDGAVIKIEEPAGTVTEIGYSLWGLTETVRQYGTTGGVSVDQTQRHFYDAYDRLCRTSIPETGDKLIEYDAADRIIAHASGLPSGSTCDTPYGPTRVALGYDSAGRANLTDFSGSTPDISISYNALGAPVSKSRGTTTWTYAYLSNGALQNETLAVDGYSFSTSYGYNAEGVQTSRTLPSGATITYGVNGLGLPTSLNLPGGHGLSGASYHPNNSLSSVSFSNGIQMQNHLDGRQMLALRTYSSGAGLLAGWSYGRDPLGMITAIQDQANTAGSRTYAYDAQNRVVSGTTGEGPLFVSYDALGNIRTKTEIGRTSWLHYDSSNRISVFDHSMFGTRPVSHDTRGNLTAIGGRSFVYDAASQTTEIFTVSTSGTSAAFYMYDANMLRVRSQTSAGTTYWVYTSDGLLAHQYEVASNKATDYIQFAGSEVARITNGTAVEFIHTDHLGSPVQGLSPTGQLRWYESYAPFGQSIDAPQANAGRPGFTGHVRDPETWLTYAEARFYHPALGRFLSNDPVGFTVEKPGMFNRYAYVLGNPVNLRDPDGRECIPQRDGSALCNPPGDKIGVFRIPAHLSPGYIGPNKPGYHKYGENKGVTVPSSSPNLTRSVEQAVINNPTPGRDRPATAAGTRNDAGISPLSGPLGDAVVSFITKDSNGNTLVVNVTIAGNHVLHPGYVAQAIIPGSSSTSIVFVGEGNARVQQGPGSALGEAVFQQKIERDMRQGLFNAVNTGSW